MIKNIVFTLKVGVLSPLTLNLRIMIPTKLGVTWTPIQIQRKNLKSPLAKSGLKRIRR